MPRVEIPAPGDLVIDTFGNVKVGLGVTLKLAGTGTNATHYSALVGGTSTTGGLVTHTNGTIVDGSAARRYVDAGPSLDLTIDGVTRQIEPVRGGVDIQIFNASASPQTWTKPSWVSVVDVFLVGAGAGGGSGRRGAAATVRCGGGGGGGGGAGIRRYRAALLGTTETVLVALGGVGGTAIAADDTDGNNGVTAGSTYFRSLAFSGMNVATLGGKGQVTAGAAGTGGTSDQAGGGAGGASSTTGAGANGTGGTAGVIRGAGGGGGGGTITVGNAHQNGGAAASYNGQVGGIAGVVPGGAGGVGTALGTEHGAVGGGGGAAGNQAGGAGGIGGAGTFPGGGGGGGGGSLNGSASGAGGAGADGIIFVVSW